MTNPKPTKGANLSQTKQPPQEQPQARSTAEIETLIGAEREKVAQAQAAIVDLTNQRKAALLATDRAEADRLGAELDETRRTARVGEEIVAALEEGLAESRQRDADLELDEIAGRANRAREAGEQLIRQVYGPAASAIADALTKVAAIEAEVREANARLIRAGRQCVPGVQDFRSAPGRDLPPRRVTRQVGPAETEHPDYAESTIHPRTGQRMNARGEVMGYTTTTIEVPARVEAFHAECLITCVRLPGVEPRTPDYWAEGPGARPRPTAVPAPVDAKQLKGAA